MLRPIIALAAAVAVLASGCGSGGSPVDVDDATLVLDSAPHAVHAGIHTTVARDFSGAVGVTLRVRPRPKLTDPVGMLTSGRANVAILDVNDLALARERGVDVVGLMAFVQRPLAAVLTRPGTSRPRALAQGRAVAVRNERRDAAIARAVVRGDGGDPEGIRIVRAGSDVAGALERGDVGAAVGFWHADGVALRERLPGARQFRVDEYGAPAYPELVLVALRETIRDEPDMIENLVGALRRGYEQVLADPEVAVETMLPRARNLDRAELLAQLRAVSPTFTAGAPRFGQLDRERLQAWARWAERSGLVDEAPDVDEAFDPRFANGATSG